MSTKVKKILYVDDDMDDHYIFSKVINEQFPDMQLLLFNSVDRFLPYIKDENTVLPEAIFLDLNMTGNESFQCLIEIRKMERTKDIPVVIYSTVQSATVAIEAYALGAFKFITKPHSLDEITREIKKVVAELEKINSPFWISKQR